MSKTKLSSSFLPFLLVLGSISTESVKLEIPFRENHDSVFSFSLEMYDAEQYLECSGNIVVRKINHQIVFTFKNFDLNKHIGLSVKDIHNAVALPIVIKINHNGKMTDPVDYNDWGFIDPRMVIKVFKYSDMSINGQIDEIGWETALDNESACKAEARGKNGKKDLHIHVYYNLENCLVNSDGVSLSYLEHYRVIDLFVPRNENHITRYEYNYKKATDVTDAQNSINIQFERFEEY